MMEIEKVKEGLHICTTERSDCTRCGYHEYGYPNSCHFHLMKDAFTAIEELMAQVRDKDYLIQQQADEIERLRRDVKKQQEKMIELAGRLPKKGKYVHGKEISREYIGDCLVSIDYEDWRCSVCGIVFEQWNIPKFKFCPNCGANMEVQDAYT